jgi:hypothetical protein
LPTRFRFPQSGGEEINPIRLENAITSLEDGEQRNGARAVALGSRKRLTLGVDEFRFS